MLHELGEAHIDCVIGNFIATPRSLRVNPTHTCLGIFLDRHRQLKLAWVTALQPHLNEWFNVGDIILRARLVVEMVIQWHRLMTHMAP